MKIITAMAVVLISAVGGFASTSVVSDTKIEANEMELFTQKTHPQLYCLALNVYHESRSDNLAGQFAVSDVVLNRVRDSRWPNTICEVVYQGPVSQWHLDNTGKTVPIKHKCQFSWYCDGKRDDTTDEESWRKAQVVAYQIVHNNMFRGITEGATHYHATYVNPSWNRRFTAIGRIGAHVFFRAE